VADNRAVIGVIAYLFNILRIWGGVSVKDRKMLKAAALKYDKEKNQAPVLVAAGQGAWAEKIIKLAREYKIPLQKNDYLAEALSKLELGEEIPPDLYEAVALVLAHIMATDAHLSGGER
jgi:flagellar biosynthesis protein